MRGKFYKKAKQYRARVQLADAERKRAKQNQRQQSVDASGKPATLCGDYWCAMVSATANKSTINMINMINKRLCQDAVITGR